MSKITIAKFIVIKGFKKQYLYYIIIKGFKNNNKGSNNTWKYEKNN